MIEEKPSKAEGTHNVWKKATWKIDDPEASSPAPFLTISIPS
ncbi:hypothetical protein QG37_07135 [Candidozyma auris]|nr:hypothetical protein QG37_07135 [[Candida] auris]